MKLPEDVRSTWMENRGRLQALAQAEKADGRVLLGGGTMLATRWKHRRSWDIDVLMPERSHLSELLAGRRLGETGWPAGRAMDEFGKHVRLSVKGTVIDVSCGAPKLPGLERNEVVESADAWVLSNAQILRGKLARANQWVTRDAFDLISAAQADPEALQTAVNALTRHEAALAVRHMESANTKMQNEAEEVLLGVGNEYQADYSTLGKKAAETIQQHRYTALTVKIQDGQTEIGTETAAGRIRRIRFRPDENDRILLSTGIGEHALKNIGIPPDQLSAAIRQLTNEGQTEIRIERDRPEETKRLAEAVDRAARKAETKDRNGHGVQAVVRIPDAGGSGGTEDRITQGAPGPTHEAGKPER